jgi:protein gp37
LNLDGISWVIVGGESGPSHRPVAAEWVKEIKAQSISQKVPFFFKQWGGRTSKSNGRLLDGKEWNEFPSIVSCRNRISQSKGQVLLSTT